MTPCTLVRRLSLAVLLLAAGVAGAQPPTGGEARVIVKLVAAADARGPASPAGAVERERRLAAVAGRRGTALRLGRSLGRGVSLVTARGIDSAALARRLAADPEVAYAVPDRRMRIAALPNDRYYAAGGPQGPVEGQWYLRQPNSLFVAAIDAERAWDATRGSADIVVAVLDTGVRFDHPDLGKAAEGGKLLPGRDFVRDRATANDGGGRDDDASDPGDFVTQAELDAGFGGDCEVDRSSWHGTQVAGILGALTDNGEGIAGAGWHTRLLPVRVLGKCGGFESDVIAAMRWAAGLAVEGEPANPTPARILNLSLGAEGGCDAAYEEAVADVLAAGVAVVASAGNSSGHAIGAPANCPGVIAVAGLRHAGSKVGFSDLGPEVALSAPAGNCVNIGAGEPCLYPLMTTTDLGEQGPAGPGYTDSYDITVGTSFAAPLVAGSAALALALQPGRTPAELRALLQGSARPFPTSGAAPGTPQCSAPRYTAGGDPVDQVECYCTTSTCGAGMLDARAALQAALGVVARLAVDSASARVGQGLTLDAGGSLLSGARRLATVQWQITDADGGVETLSGTVVSWLPRVAGPAEIVLSVTDSEGASSSARESVAVAGPVGGGGGGGGALGLGYLLALGVAVAWTHRVITRTRPDR